jgi:redox-sensitive bicupin YhaK (pirin superfamily)
MEHKDSFGHHGVIEAGDVQWMTAGSGLVHSEMPGVDIVNNGGRLEGFQIWVNLPKRDKMAAPRYQERKAAAIPVAENAERTAKARVIAGESLGKKGAVETHTPIVYVHFTLQPGATVQQTVPAEQNAIAYVFRGEVSFNGAQNRAVEGRLAAFGRDGDTIEITNPGPTPADLLILSGEPLNEPVARYGPFVMNTKDELYRAFEDYRSGKMGVIG